VAGVSEQALIRKKDLTWEIVKIEKLKQKKEEHKIKRKRVAWIVKIRVVEGCFKIIVNVEKGIRKTG
jgi:hypothetical protein